MLLRSKINVIAVACQFIEFLGNIVISCDPQCNVSWTSIYKFGLSVCLSVCLFVCLYPINVKTAEPIGPKFFVGHLGTSGKVYESSKFQIFVSIKIRSSLIFLKFWKSAKFFVKIRELFLFCFTMYTKRTCSELI